MRIKLKAEQSAFPFGTRGRKSISRGEFLYERECKVREQLRERQWRQRLNDNGDVEKISLDGAAGSLSDNSRCMCFHEHD
jgi:hypothetical protein